MGSVVKESKIRIENEFKKLPKGYFIEWSGQYENQVRAQNRLMIIIPITLLIISFVLYFTFRSVKEMLIVLTSLPVALIGGVYSMFFFDVNFSVASTHISVVAGDGSGNNHQRNIEIHQLIWIDSNLVLFLKTAKRCNLAYTFYIL